MKQIVMLILSSVLPMISCKNFKTLEIGQPKSGQIVANHEIVDDFSKIPKYYINKVKSMMIFFPGESHSEAHKIGLKLLQEKYPEYVCNISNRERNTNQYLRVNSGDWMGEDIWFTWHAFPTHLRPSNGSIIMDLLKEYHNNGTPANVIGFGWCWDMVSFSRKRLLLSILQGKVRFTRDPIYGVHWRGQSVGGPDGNSFWGLDSTSFNLTNNRVNMETYLKATEEYISFCEANQIATKVIFTTGPVDSFTGQSGYQGSLKNQYIRNYVFQDSTRILFDYADILCHNDDNTICTKDWKHHFYPVITPKNLGDGSVGHISPEGAIRLAKAQWWMLARIAGWDGKQE